MLHFSKDTTVETPFQRENVFVVHAASGKGLVDSTLGNIKNYSLNAGTPGILVLFDESYL